MDVVVHQAEGEDLETEPVAEGDQAIKVSLPVVAVDEDRLALVAARNDVVDGAFGVETEGAGHSGQ